MTVTQRVQPNFAVKKIRSIFLAASLGTASLFAGQANLNAAEPNLQFTSGAAFKSAAVAEPAPAPGTKIVIPVADLQKTADKDGNITINVQVPPQQVITSSSRSSMGGMLPMIFVMVGISIFSAFFFLWLQGRQMKKMMSPAKKGESGFFKKEISNVRFGDVAGIEEAKEELEEIVNFLKNPRKYEQIGAKIPRGALMVGSPGTGKTLMAKAVAGEAGVPFFSVAGSSFVEMYVGVGASRVREIFAEARKNAPCILFIDEIDTLGRHRGQGNSSHAEHEQTLNQLLVEMDGFDTASGVIVIGATNRVDMLDQALLRPGRFDRQVNVPLPDIVGREKILAVHTRGKKLAIDADLAVIARATPGFSGAELANLVNEAAIAAANADKQEIGRAELEEARDKVRWGKVRKSMALSAEEKKITAWHEAGHALVTYFLPDSVPLHKATILPRGDSLGMVMRLHKADRVSVTQNNLVADMAVAMGGRVGEEALWKGKSGEITTGAVADIEMATSCAHRMVTEWGMSKLGMVRYAESSRTGYRPHLSERLSSEIDAEIKRLTDDALDTAKKIVEEHKEALERLANALLEYELLDDKEIEAVILGRPIERAKPVVIAAPANQNTGQPLSKTDEYLKRYLKP